MSLDHMSRKTLIWFFIMLLNVIINVTNSTILNVIKYIPLKVYYVVMYKVGKYQVIRFVLNTSKLYTIK